MPKNSKLTSKIEWNRLSFKEPRVAMRAVIGVLLVANLAAAIVAFKPFGGSAEDLRKDQDRLSTQLRQVQSKLQTTRDHAEKIKVARQQGEEFLAKYIMEKRLASEITVEQMSRIAGEAGVRFLPENATYEEIEGSNALQMMVISAGFEGSYAALAKLVNAMEKAPQFLIIDSMNLNAPQQQSAQQNGGQVVNVNMKLIAFVREDSVALP